MEGKRPRGRARLPKSPLTSGIRSIVKDPLCSLNVKPRAPNPAFSAPPIGSSDGWTATHRKKAKLGQGRVVASVRRARRRSCRFGARLLVKTVRDGRQRLWPGATALYRGILHKARRRSRWAVSALTCFRPFLATSFVVPPSPSSIESHQYSVPDGSERAIRW